MEQERNLPLQLEGGDSETPESKTFVGRYWPDTSKKEWKNLQKLTSLIEGDIVLNACYAASNEAITTQYGVFKKNGHKLLQKVANHTGKNVYGTASWFISNPAALLNLNESITDKLEKEYPNLELLFDLIKVVGPIAPAGVEDPTYYSYKNFKYEYDNMGVWYKAEPGGVEGNDLTKLPGYLFFWFNGEIGITSTQWLDTPIGMAWYAIATHIAKQ